MSRNLWKEHYYTVEVEWGELAEALQAAREEKHTIVTILVGPNSKPIIITLISYHFSAPRPTPKWIDKYEIKEFDD